MGEFEGLEVLVGVVTGGLMTGFGGWLARRNSDRDARRSAAAELAPMVTDLQAALEVMEPLHPLGNIPESEENIWDGPVVRIFRPDRALTRAIQDCVSVAARAGLQAEASAMSVDLVRWETDVSQWTGDFGSTRPTWPGDRRTEIWNEALEASDSRRRDYRNMLNQVLGAARATASDPG